MADKETKEQKGLFDKICQATKEQIDEMKRSTTRKKLQTRIKTAYTDTEDNEITARENIENERHKIKDDYKNYDINVVVDNVLTIHALTGVNFYTGKAQEGTPTHRYIVEQEYQTLFDESIS